VAIQIRRSASSSTAEVVFTIPDQHHFGVVSVVGTFNDWKPGVDVFVLRPDGTRVAEVVVDDDEIHFRYLGSGGVWFDDPDAEQDERGCVIRLT